MKKSKKLIALVLAVVVCLSSFVVLVYANNGTFFKYLNSASDNTNYGSMLYYEGGDTLFVFLDNWNLEPNILDGSEFDDISQNIRYIQIYGGFVEIKNAFNNVPNLRTVTFDCTVLDLDNSFNNCSNLREIEFKNIFQTGWGEAGSVKSSFNDCSDLSLVRFGFLSTDSNYDYQYICGYYSSFNNIDKNGVSWLGYVNPLEYAEDCFSNTTVCYKNLYANIRDFKLSNGKTGINLTWKNNFDNTPFYVYRMTEAELENYTPQCSCTDPCNCLAISTRATYIDSVYVESYTDETVKSGERYYYYDNRKPVGITYLSKPVVTSCVSSGSSKATIKWQKVEGAEGYYVYQSTTGKSGSWKKIGNLSADKLSCTATGLKTNTKYYFCVKAYAGKDVSYGTTKTVTVGVPTILSAKKSGTSITLKWAQQSNTAYYRIYAKAPGAAEYTRVATITDPKTTTYTFKQFSNQGTQIKVRAFYKSGSSTIYSTTPIYTVK